MNAMRHNIKRIFFGGFFIRGHPYTMDTISYAIRFWSKVCFCAVPQNSTVMA
jgi:type II pantothenate kinase